MLALLFAISLAACAPTLDTPATKSSSQVIARNGEKGIQPGMTEKEVWRILGKNYPDGLEIEFLLDGGTFRLAYARWRDSSGIWRSIENVRPGVMQGQEVRLGPDATARYTW
jgi:hypothetical protein